METSQEVENLYELDRKELLKLFKDSPVKLERFFLPIFPIELLDFRPDIEDVWTIREHVVHLFDTEAAAYIFTRKAIADPGGAQMWYPGESWAKPIDYASQNLDDDMSSILKKLRSLTYEKLMSMEDQDWTKYFCNNSDGENVDIAYFLKVFAPHIDWHLEYIERNEKLWEQQTRK